MSEGLSVLWASDGSESCLLSAGIMRALLVPVASRIHVLTVAPHEGSKFLLQNVLHLSSPPDKDALAEADEAVDRALQALGEVDVPVDKSVRWGIAAREIVEAAAEQESDIIVLAMKPHGMLRRMVLGDTGLQVLQSTSTSVLLSRPFSRPQLGPVVLLCEDAEHFGVAVAHAKRLNLPAGVRIYLLGFVEPARLGPGMPPSFSQFDLHQHRTEQARRRTALQKAFAEATETLAVPGRTLEPLIVEDHRDAGLEKLVADLQPALIVMGAGPFGSRDFSSTADAVNVATQVQCSVLVAR